METGKLTETCPACGHAVHYLGCFCGCRLNPPGSAAIYSGTPADKITFTSGASSSKIPRFDYIPYEALVRLARRFEDGVESHKERAWNARQNPQALKDKEFLIARAAHAIGHGFRFIAKLEGSMPDDGDDDASAIMWAGACLCAATTEPKVDLKGPESQPSLIGDTSKCLQCGHSHTAPMGTCICGCLITRLINK